ncbi:MAG: DUF2232 domain-containing protein [Christensenellales bacterium]
MQAYRLWLSPRSASLFPLLCMALVLLLMGAPLSQFYMFTLALFLFPFITLLGASLAGVLPTLLSLLILSGGAWRSLGPDGGLAVLAYLAPLALCSLCCLQLKLPWHRTVAALLFIFVLCVMLIYLWMQRRSNEQLFSLIAQRVTGGIDSMPERDSLLQTFYQFGLLSLPDTIASQPLVEAGSGWTFSPAALQEFYKQIATRVDLWLRALLPTLISSHGLYVCTLGFFTAQHYGQKQAQRLALKGPDDTRADELCPSLGLPAFSLLHLPRKAGGILLVLSVGYLLARISGNATLALSGQMMYNVFSALYAIQGLALVNHLQKRRGSKPALRALTMIILFFVLQPALVFIGLIDQFTDPRKLRGPKAEDTQGGDSL